MKKIFVTLFSLGILTFFVGGTLSAAEKNDVKFVNEHGISITNNDFDRLLNLGFTEEDIDLMNQEEYDLNKDIKGELLTKETKYIKTIEKISQNQYQTLEENESINSVSSLESTPTETVDIELTKEEYYSELEKEKEKEKGKEKYSKTSGDEVSIMSNLDEISTSYKTMTTSIYSLDNREYRLANRLLWDKMPATRSYDVNAITINDSQFRPISDSQYGKQTWKLYDWTNAESETGSATYNSESSYWKKSPSGYGTRMNLKNDTKIVSSGYTTGDEVNYLSSYIYFSVNELDYGTESIIDAYGAYRHAVESVSFNFGLGITYGYPTISVSPSYETSFDDEINTQASKGI